MAHLILATIAGTLVGDFLLVAWLAYRASLAPKIQPPRTPAKAAVPRPSIHDIARVPCFHISHITLLCPGKAVPCVRVFGDTQDDLIAGLLLAAREDQ